MKWNEVNIHNLARLTVRLELTVVYFTIFRQARPHDFFRECLQLRIEIACVARFPYEPKEISGREKDWVFRIRDPRKMGWEQNGRRRGVAKSNEFTQSNAMKHSNPVRYQESYKDILKSFRLGHDATASFKVHLLLKLVAFRRTDNLSDIL